MYGMVEPIIPTVLFWLGAVNKSVYGKSLRDNISLPYLHSAFFLPDPEPTISTGIKAMTAEVLDLYKN